ncbi:pyridoxamine 5'-phosphate oxidase family protein [Hansschlegelia plantiphila]|uniref:2Fe-2S iron-sulfur cluster binding domain-containing protein n=1 Tax=Hansschlegelia plantiphila TaxID=374655 RepID=A0A9W6J1N1_9HYPH|nr:pyridoxamine 5'-phosphate oxidase family protein [Hansschlegelia plantiphila]GLK67625.1 hypothetical protein GCM10008179_12630 [Hansschlegelia plantiphila]
MDGGAETDFGSPWHEGELELQRHAGVVERMAAVGRRSVRDHLIEQHRAFYPQLPFVVAGSVDPAGDVWATVIAGRPGFLRSPDPHTLEVASGRDRGDPADAGLDDGDAVGLLGIDLHTRRRNRLNGVVRRASDAEFAVEARESFGNCPQYISPRDVTLMRDPAAPGAARAETLDALDDRARAAITAADTLFVASYVDRPGAERRVDVSHRGGRPGFVRIDPDGTLTIPDFSGNLFFNTLGNIHANPRAGLLFVDFATGDALQLTGGADVVLDGPEIAAFTGAERLLRFRPSRIVRRADALPLRWSARADGASPNTVLSGNWTEAAQRLEAQPALKAWRRLKVARIVQESATIRSLHLEPTDGGALILHTAGQHLPIRLSVAGLPAPATRAYTISCAPSDGVCRISVRAQGAASRALHELEVGDEIEALPPAGRFGIDARATRPAVMIAAGVGITPMVAMLRHLVFEGLRTRRTRPTALFYAARSRSERAFDDELVRLADAGRGAIRLIRALTDVSEAEYGRDYEIDGRIDLAAVRSRAALDDCDVYLCGPYAFMESLRDGLRGLGLPEDRIHAEAFAPTATAPSPHEAVAEVPVTVAFAPSGATARWTPAAGSLLDLAESVGLAPRFSCRVGSCGTCRARVRDGAVAYASAPTMPLSQGEALMCVGAPAATGGSRLEIAFES